MVFVFIRHIIYFYFLCIMDLIDEQSLQCHNNAADRDVALIKHRVIHTPRNKWIVLCFLTSI